MCSATFSLRCCCQSGNTSVIHSLTLSTLRIRNVTKHRCRCRCFCCFSYGMCLVYFIYYFTHSLGAERDFVYRTTFYGNLLCIFALLFARREQCTKYVLIMGISRIVLSFWYDGDKVSRNSMSKFNPRFEITLGEKSIAFTGD